MHGVKSVALCKQTRVSIYIYIYILRITLSGGFAAFVFLRLSVLLLLLYCRLRLCIHIFCLDWWPLLRKMRVEGGGGTVRVLHTVAQMDKYRT